MYDMADSIFSMNIGSVYFPLWFTGVLGGTAAQFGYANSLAMLSVFLTAPMLGAVSDQAGRRPPLLIVSAVLCIACTAWLGTGGLTTSLILFALASYFHQTGFVFYNTLLPSVSTVQNRGLASGIGITLSNLGMLLAVGSGLVLLERIGHVNVFRFTAVT